jgi:hypothetical protein
VQTQVDAKIAKSLVTAKGDLIVATASGTVVAQAVGTNGQVLTANSAEANGVEWTTISTTKTYTTQAFTSTGSITLPATTESMKNRFLTGIYRGIMAYLCVKKE